jgi:hypothetical protein
MTFFVQLPGASYPALLTPGFDQGDAYGHPTAQAMMWLAQLVYEPDDKIDAILRQWQLERLAHLHSPAGASSATQGFVCRSPGTTIVAFAGTDPGVLKTVLTDADTIPGPDGIHPGFAQALAAVLEPLVAAIPTRGRLLVTGHSLGAALAVLAAFHLQEKLASPIHVDAVYAFGLPRVGGPAFAAAYEPALGARTHRLVNGDDPVPAVPFARLGYVHVGRRLSCPHAGTFDPAAHPAGTADNDPSFTQVETDNAGHMIEELLHGRWPLPAQPEILGWLYDLLPGGVADHMQARYLKALGMMPAPTPPGWSS